MKKEKLFEQFPPVSSAEWMGKITSDLKGADFNKKLVWKTGEGFDIMPFYRKEDLEGLSFIDSLHGKKGNGWRVRQDIEVGDYAEANKKALALLMRGVDSLGFVIADPDSVNEKNINLLLDKIILEAVEINFLSNGKAKEIFECYSAITSARGLSPDQLAGAIEADPLGRLMVNGKLCVSPGQGFDYLADLTGSSLKFPGLRTVHIRVSDYLNAGAGTVQELAFGISMGNEYLVQLTERGIDAADAASKIRFSFGIGSNYFFEIAKLRAARLLWAAVQDGYSRERGLTRRMEIHSITGRWNKTLYDPYVNMLRTQTEAMSAVLGGTDSLTVEPFNIVYTHPEEFSERIARNQQLILKEEAHFDKVADPAAGSYYIENLTSLLAGNAWKLFIETEEQGGFLAALKSGFIQKNLAAAAGKKKNDVAFRKIILLGTNQYPRAAETIDELSVTNDLFTKKEKAEDCLVEPFELFRGSEEFEKIRIATDRSGKRPAVFLLQLGNPLMRKARAQFSASFFGCAGYKVIDNTGFENVEDGIRAALDSKADIIVICSSDDEYAGFVPAITNAFGGTAIIVIAGNPASADELRASGVDQFIHLKSNVPETLRTFNTRLGINNNIN